MRLRDWLPLVGISICVFIFNMSEFMPIGLLTGIAEDFSISESQAGLIISMYAWAVAILSLPMMLLLRKMEYRRMLLMCVLLFAIFQFMSGVSTSYWMLVVSRIGVAVAHAVFWSIAAPLAVRVVEPRYSKVAISAVATGTSVAMIVGLPLGRVIGLALGWRMSFMTIAVIAVVALALLVAVFPKLSNPGTFTLERVPSIFRSRAITGIYILVITAVIGYYTTYSYIEPFLGQVAGMSDTMITVCLTVFGIFGIIGSILFSKFYGRFRFRYLVAALAGSAIIILLFRPSADVYLGPVLVCAVWGLCVTSFNVSTQNEIIWVSESDATPIVMSLYSGLYNVGIASGSLIGGAVTDVSVSNIGYVGGAFLAVATLFTALYLVKVLRRAGESKAQAPDSEHGRIERL